MTCAILSLCLSTLAAALALRLEGRVSSLGVRLEVAHADMAALEQRNALSTSRISWLGRRLQVVSHPLLAALSWPVAGAVTSPFGARSCCGGASHPGIDIDAATGDTVRPAGPGVVVEAGWEDGYGNRIVVDHGRGLETVYAHLDSISIEKGTLVTESTQLGTVGCTGSCAGDHLHFEVRLDGVPSDPLLWLPTRDPPRAAALSWATPRRP